jgi:hypothetical protein
MVMPEISVFYVGDESQTEEYGIQFANWDEPSVIYSSYKDAREVLDHIGIEGTIVKRLKVVTDWQDA